MADQGSATYQAQDRNLALDLVRVTEAAALAASRWMGRGNKIEADGAATEAMRRAFDTVAIDGTVVIGEGEMDEAPMLFIGEKVGSGGPKMDIAVDPLEGTTLTAKGGPNAMTVIALAEAGRFLHAPDCYMDKIAVGPGLPAGVVNLGAPAGENMRALASGARVRCFRSCVVYAGSGAARGAGGAVSGTGRADYVDTGWRCGGGDCGGAAWRGYRHILGDWRGA